MAKKLEEQVWEDAYGSVSEVGGALFGIDSKSVREQKAQAAKDKHELDLMNAGLEKLETEALLAAVSTPKGGGKGGRGARAPGTAPGRPAMGATVAPGGARKSSAPPKDDNTALYIVGAVVGVVVVGGVAYAATR